MHHCSTGPSAWDIGRTYSLDMAENNSAHNILLALVEWIESGLAPSQIVGTKYFNDDIAALALTERSEFW
jgi:feruloyl esterase